MQQFLTIALLALFLTGCSYFGDEEDTLLKEDGGPSASAEELYNLAMDDLLERKYLKAVDNLHEIERKYPFSPLAKRAQVMTAYAYYRDGEYDDAINVIDSFTRLNPGNKDVAYMYYLRALSFYEQISDVGRDQKITELAKGALREIILRFPDTDYARDAKLKLDLVNDHLAGKEMTIGRFYQKQKQYVAAINRFTTVVKKFDTTSHVAEALYRLTELYLSIGAIDEAQKNAAVLGYNFPKSKWYKYAFDLVGEGTSTPHPKGDGSWFSLFDDDEVTPVKPLESSEGEKSLLDKILRPF